MRRCFQSLRGVESWDTFQSPLTCPQADHDTQVFRVFLHDDGSQDLAAKQGGLETVGESIEAPVAQHGYLVMEGAACERKLWGQEAMSGPPSLVYVHRVSEWAGRSSSTGLVGHLSPSHV